MSKARVPAFKEHIVYKGDITYNYNKIRGKKKKFAMVTLKCGWQLGNKANYSDWRSHENLVGGSTQFQSCKLSKSSPGYKIKEE